MFGLCRLTKLFQWLCYDDLVFYTRCDFILSLLFYIYITLFYHLFHYYNRRCERVSERELWRGGLYHSQRLGGLSVH